MTKDEVKKLRMNSPESLQFLNNATKFYNLMMMYRCAIREIQTKLEVLDDEFSVENNRNPISFIKTRIHMIVEMPAFFAKGKTPMRVELQIRTNGMDFWATLEHQLRYKKGIEEMPGYDEISEELLHSAKAIIEADNEMQRIKDKIGMFHEI